MVVLRAGERRENSEGLYFVELDGLLFKRRTDLDDG